MDNEPYHHFGDRRHPDDYRKEEIEKLKRAIQATENRLVLSMPDVGLSNLIRFLVTRPGWGERKPIFAYLDCDALDDCLNREVFFAEIARQFYEQSVGNRLEAGAEGYQRLHRLLHQVEGDRFVEPPLAVVVNKADKMLMSADEAFYRKLKVLADDNKRVCYIFAAGLRAANVVDPMEPLFAGRWLKVGRFNERDFAGAVAEEAQRLGRNLNSAEREQLAYLTGRHAGLLRAISPAVDGLKLDLPEQRIDLVEHLVTQAGVQSRCKRVWDVLNSAQQAMLQAIASKKPKLEDEDILTWLLDFDLIEEYEGKYRLFSPIFQHYVATQATPLECIRIEGASTILRDRQEIVVAGTVFKGGQKVDISPLELRLIACLKRERKIYTQAKIAEYVYYEEYEPGEGVPDPRIGGLVSQIRKKLGNDRYIEAHYGQGYEFIDGC